ncbi:MAG: hypothetical protein R3326_06560 [Gemmatimonadota bacterium]|nr:hypothetical protein [Gemmatimonadota bacterium]
MSESDRETTRRLNSTRRGIVSAVFQDASAAEDAYDEARELGYEDEQISVLMSKQARDEYFPEERVEHEEESKAAEGAGVGGSIGLAVGAIAGAIAAIGTTVTLPGIGIVVAGPLAGALAGAGAAGATGTLIGALVGAGMSEERAAVYRTAIEEGGVVLAVQPESEEDADELEERFEEAGGEEVFRSE